MCLTLPASIVALAVLAAAAPQPVGQRTGTAIPLTKRSSLVNADKSINFDALESHLAAVKASAKPFTVQFDTGSSGLFLAGSACNSSCNNRTMWDPSASSTSHDLGQSFSFTYEDGSNASGEQYTDTVSIAGFSAMNQTFGAAKELSWLLTSEPIDGLMGMAFEPISTDSTSPVFQTLINQGSLPEPVFSFKVSSSGAELYIGGSNPDLYTGEFTYTSVTHKSYWQVNMDGVDANGATILTNVDAVIDSGAALVVGTPLDVWRLHNALGGKPAPDVGDGYYTFSCDSFPTISFTFGCKSFEIAASALNLGQVSFGSPDCVSGIVAVEVAFWIVGDLFLRGVYTTFDMDNDNARVGFADLA